MSHIQIFHGQMLAVGHADADDTTSLAGIELDHWLHHMVMGKSDGVRILAGQADVGAPFILAQHHRCFLIRRVGNFAVQRVGVPWPWHPHRRHTAMEEKAAIGVEIGGGRSRLIKPGLHSDIAPIKNG